MLKVVIADDEARILSLIRLLPDWDALGMEVAGTAANGLEALALIEREKPDILITDIRMPGCQGLELIERARRAVPDIEIIIISGYAHFEYAQTAIKLGVGDYLLKPIKKDELTATLSKLAQRCRAKHPSDPAGRRRARAGQGGASGKAGARGRVGARLSRRGGGSGADLRLRSAGRYVPRLCAQAGLSGPGARAAGDHPRQGARADRPAHGPARDAACLRAR